MGSDAFFLKELEGAMTRFSKATAACGRALRVFSTTFFLTLLTIAALLVASPNEASAQTVCSFSIGPVPYGAVNFTYIQSLTVNSADLAACDTNFPHPTDSGLRPTPQTGTTANGSSFTAQQNANDNSITYTPGAGFAGTETFNVVYRDGPGGALNRTATVTVTVLSNAPTVTSISPTAGPTAGSTSVVITGTSFSGASAVAFGATPATSYTIDSATQITATSPAGTGTVDVTVTTPAGTSATSAADQFTYVAAPTVTSISPSAGPAAGGTSVIITGTNLSGATAVSFGGAAATGFTVNSATQITATSPAGTGTIDVRVTTSGGTSATSAADQFTYVPAPTVTSISPTAGPTGGGTTVTITGTNLSGATAVTFGATAATGFTVNSTTQITATSPAGTGTVDVRVTTSGGTSATSAADQFTYVPAPTVTSITPTAGPTGGGTTVTITGTGFSGTTAVTFGATAATSFTVNSAIQITATSPAGTGTIDIRVTTTGGTSATTAADHFTYVAAPTVTSISPSAGPTGGGTSIVITGTGFSGTTAVTFGATAATGFTVNSATQITATSPAGSAGTVDVRVTTSGGTSATSAADQFTYVASPTVTSISPTAGPAGGGTSVTITGTNFSGSTAVTFGATAATGFTVNSATQITATSPAGTGTVDVRVTTSGGTSATSAADQFTYVPAPAVTSISPTSGATAGGTTVTITGTGFAGATAITFGATAATGFTVNSPTQITATSPAGAAGTVDIRVTTPGGTSATSAADQFTYAAAPTVTALSANRGPTSGGGTVTLTGTNFTDATDVSFGGAAAAFLVVDATNIVVFALPAHAAGLVNVIVTTPGGASAAAAANEFTYVGPPAVTSVSPTSGPTAGSTSVVIAGTGFTGATNVRFGATNASFVVNSDTQITATSPAGAAGTVDITVRTVGGTSATSAADQFTYVSAPTVTSISPTAGPTTGSTTVTITGTNFSSATAVTFGATAATGFTVNSATQITATSPAGTGTVDVRVTTAGGTSATSAADQFTYVAGPTVTGLSPTSGPTAGGTSVVITGTGLSGATSVAFGATAATGYTINSATQITATSPAGAVGIVDITVTTIGGTSATSLADQFTYAVAPITTDSAATVAANSTDNPITLNITGGAPDTLATPTLPAHGTVAINGAAITYTPTAGYSGSDSFTYTAANAGGTSAVATVTITVSPPTLALSAIAATGQATVPYSDSITASNGTAPYSYAVTAGSLPNGLTLAPGGTLSGTPLGTGTANFTVTATDTYGATGAQAYSIVVGAPVVQLTAPVTGSLPTATLGSSYGPITFTASGGNSPHSFASTGALPPGLTLSSGGVLSGTPTTAGNYSFSVSPQDATAPGLGGPFIGTAETFTINVGSPRVTFVIQSPANGSFAFSSPEPSLNVTISTSGGNGTSGPLDVPVGSHAISFALPAGFALASAACSDPQSSLDPATLSGTIAVQSGSDVTCTIVAGDTKPTMELIGSFLEARSELIIANQPDTARRLGRLTGAAPGSGGVSGFGLGYTDPRMPVSLRIGKNEASFAYSMARSRNASADGPTVTVPMSAPAEAGMTAGSGMPSGPDGLPIMHLGEADAGNKAGSSPFRSLGVAPQAEGDADPQATRFDIWAEGKFARFSAAGGDGRFGILHAGADYLVSPRLLLGLGVQVDWTDMEADDGASIDGTGYLVGPYMTARLTERLYFDARAAWGKSSNTASPLGTYEDELDGTRWLISGALIGQYDIDRWRIEPSARLTYFEEKTDAYTDGLGLPIPEIEIATGTFEFGPKFSYRMELDSGMSFEPFVSLEGIWTFEQKNTGVSATSSPGLADTGLRGRGEVGFSLSGGHVGSWSASAFYDGVGDDDFESWGGRLRFNKSF